MSEQQSANPDQYNRNKQQAQRKFGCPCGKWYLSYPALFTHVKQKHEGKPPGALIKPKTDKARGRPRLPTSNIEQDQSILNYDCQEQIERVLLGRSISYSEPYDYSQGSETCQDMGSHFLRAFELPGDDKSMLVCFLNYIRFFVKRRYEESYWESHKPTDIIDISNEIVRELENNRARFPLEKESLIELLFVLFRWMYKNKWTDHKLIRRSGEESARESARENNKENMRGLH